MLQYLLRLADTCLILGQRLGEWCGHAPVLEEDIALTNMALDLIGQARALLTLRRRSSRAAAATKTSSPSCATSATTCNLTLVELPQRRLRLHRAAQPAMVATWLKLLWERLRDSQRRRAGRHRRQGAEGSALPPAARRRLGGAPGRRHRRIAPPHARPRWRGCGPTCAELFEDDAVDAAAAGQRPGPGRRRAARALAGRDAARCWTRPRWRRPPTRPSAAPASAACTASTWASSWPRCSTCSAPFPGACGERHRSTPRAPSAPGPCWTPCPTPRCRRSRCASWASCARCWTDGDGAGGRAHAHLQRLPGHRGDRAQRVSRRSTRPAWARCA